jgi:hypothetical protein
VLKCHGTAPVTIKTIHGKFHFAFQRFSGEEGESNYFDVTRQFPEGYTSERLKEFSAYESNRMSYEEVEKLIERQTGAKLLSDQKIWHIVGDKAVEVSLEIQAEVRAVLAGCAMPAVQPHVDSYTPEQQEILLFDDAIQVKRQKQTREKRGDKEDNQQQEATTSSRVTTDVMMLEKATGGFASMSAAIDGDGQELVP